MSCLTCHHKQIFQYSSEITANFMPTKTCHNLYTYILKYHQYFNLYTRIPFIFIRNNSRFYFIQHYAESSTGYQRLTKSLTLQQFGWHFELRPLQARGQAKLCFGTHFAAVTINEILAQRCLRHALSIPYPMLCSINPEKGSSLLCSLLPIQLFYLFN